MTTEDVFRLITEEEERARRVAAKLESFFPNQRETVIRAYAMAPQHADSSVVRVLERLIDEV